MSDAYALIDHGPKRLGGRLYSLRVGSQTYTPEEVVRMIAAVQLYRKWAEGGDYPHDEEGCIAHYAICEALAQTDTQPKEPG